MKTTPATATPAPRLKIVSLLLMVVACLSCAEGNRKTTPGPAEDTLCDNIVMPKTITEQSISQLLRPFPELSSYKIDTSHSTFAIKGDFYGDQVEDVAVLLSRKDTVSICIVNIGAKCGYHILGTGRDENELDINYEWAGVFETVKEGEVLWSNYEEDFRSLKEVPENEKVRLKYNAIFIHADEACGGAFIFWKDGKFNWLQQE